MSQILLSRFLYNLVLEIMAETLSLKAQDDVFQSSKTKIEDLHASYEGISLVN